MKTISFMEIDNQKIIAGIENTSADPEETRIKVEALIAENPRVLEGKTREKLLEEYAVPARPGPGQINVEDTEGENIKDVFDTLGPHERLAFSKEKIPDWRETEYWINQGGIWVKEKIERLGDTLPIGVVLQENLSKAQQQEILKQTERTRLENLTPEQKAEEKEVAVTSAKREVRILKDEAEIAGETFDARAEYQIRLKAIEEKYA